MILGRETSDWVDIYKLMVFSGENPKSLKDLYHWISPISPRECLDVGFELVRARNKVIDCPVESWLQEFFISGKMDCK